MPSLAPEIRIAALEMLVTRLLLAEARRQPDPAGMLDQFAGTMRGEALGFPMEGPNEQMDRLALASAVLQFVADAKERLITEM